MEWLTREAEEAALRQIEHEQAEALKSKLPDDWLPLLMPTYTTSLSYKRQIAAETQDIYSK
ncbi:hypothetical protein DICSQDRAFT_141915 [Dichomitus squalens LYAD-421 SS1]|uniref:Uncharacterized protein n=1 Tax=Dichomitus squalens (strain LYAD-421) TaxID=732165 RepID=R7SH44_DICSQ|nr:uncharacterized protein DICSQDRAFT_141915 [Dichomitus squalens LYAD-421 SS1]EJF55479.1 hypothetical protein DICSQDRAFT_141915 [Dichomitus squalens LYAD-421 SS1]